MVDEGHGVADPHGVRRDDAGEGEFGALRIVAAPVFEMVKSGGNEVTIFVLVLGLAVGLALTWHKFKRAHHFEKETWLVGGCVATLVVLCFIAFIGFGLEGLYSGYSTGVRHGYITKLSRKGVIFRTYEGEMQIGTGQQAALQEPFAFSVKSEKVSEKIAKLVGSGQRVQLQYRQWLVMPWTVGESGYEIVDVRVDE